jgi:hypothetical protein
MPAETFNFPMHKVSTEYPESSIRIRYGKSYQFASKPVAPDERLFKLKFAAMQYYTTINEEDEEVLDLEKNPQINMRVLELFYEAHRLYQVFIYPHPVIGNVNVRFSKPLVVPEGRSGGFGVTEEFDVELIEVP